MGLSHLLLDLFSLDLDGLRRHWLVLYLDWFGRDWLSVDVMNRKVCLRFLLFLLFRWRTLGLLRILLDHCVIQKVDRSDWCILLDRDSHI